MNKLHLYIYIFLFVTLLNTVVSDTGKIQEDNIVDDEIADDEIAEDNSLEQKYVAPEFIIPKVEGNFFFLDWFDEPSAIGKKWVKSKAKKEGVTDDLSGYNGQWAIEVPEPLVILGDYGLIAKSKAHHHAISSKFVKPFTFSMGKDLNIQYEVKYQEGQECGGGYLKLVTYEASNELSNFHDKTPYTIMFGPDKCGLTSKVHFIIRHKNPVNGTVTEHHAKQPTKSLTSYFDDKRTHLYSLLMKPDNSYKIEIDGKEIQSGNMLNDMEPSIIPPKQIYDETDKKPNDWDDREMIEDIAAVKPSDWDENQPKEIPDMDQVKPEDWLESVEALVPDSEARKPDDWDDEMDGEWEPKKVPNPECEGKSGCGPWKRPMTKNPLYKGKWIRPKIKNPDYKGKWTPRLVDNPNYFEPDPFRQLEQIGGIGIELWTMSPNIVFDNILVTDDKNVAINFAKQTFWVKKEQEDIFEKASTSSSSTGVVNGFIQQFLELAEEKPWLWAVAVLAILIPVIIIAVFCFGRKTSKVAQLKKNDDLLQNDVDDQDEEFEQVEMEAVTVPDTPEKVPEPSEPKVQQTLDEEEPIVKESEGSRKSSTSTTASTRSSQSPSRRSKRKSQNTMTQEDDNKTSTTNAEQLEDEKRSPRQRRVRARRAD